MVAQLLPVSCQCFNFLLESNSLPWCLASAMRSTRHYESPPRLATRGSIQSRVAGQARATPHCLAHCLGRHSCERTKYQCGIVFEVPGPNWRVTVSGARSASPPFSIAFIFFPLPRPTGVFGHHQGGCTGQVCSADGVSRDRGTSLWRDCAWRVEKGSQRRRGIWLFL